MGFNRVTKQCFDIFDERSKIHLKWFQTTKKIILLMNINQETTIDRHLFKDSIIKFNGYQEKVNTKGEWS